MKRIFSNANLVTMGNYKGITEGGQFLILQYNDGYDDVKNEYKLNHHFKQMPFVS